MSKSSSINSYKISELCGKNDFNYWLIKIFDWNLIALRKSELRKRTEASAIEKTREIETVRISD